MQINTKDGGGKNEEEKANKILRWGVGDSRGAGWGVGGGSSGRGCGGGEDASLVLEGLKGGMLT